MSDLPWISKDLRRKLVSIMVHEIDCGPFDGGCLVFAQGAQKALGGDIHVIEGRIRWNRGDDHGPLLAHHAVLKHPSGAYLDADGWCKDGPAIVERFQRLECCSMDLKDAFVRSMRDGDLPDAARHPDLQVRIARAVRASLAQQMLAGLEDIVFAAAPGRHQRAA